MVKIMFGAKLIPAGLIILFDNVLDFHSKMAEPLVYILKYLVIS